ncbi:MAG: peptidyl-prolyl cis-trans isomerase [Sphingomonas bacterium]|uniref:peptidylprolyl isomerase n=1 Tax=Sphingomonas bacterium TaxID=1895847 RepID=UPI00261C2826|nr:peptidylprolyl isomerase [Sphingomonas bacterium]MDB5710437.1 peptidyl-prolyl cis-trans isomerase [Sphingomonas bacterium]
MSLSELLARNADEPAASPPTAIGGARARLSLLLCAAGAVIGLIVAGYGLFTAQGTRLAGVPAEDAAVVNGVPILRSDLIQQLSALYGVQLSRSTPAQRRKVLDDLIREELYVQRGVEMGLPNDEIEVRQALVLAAEAQVAQDAMTARPSEPELRNWYATHRSRYASEGMMTLHEWIVPPGADARAVAANLRRGMAPQAQELSSSGRVDDGTEFYFAARAHLGGAAFAVAATLADGAVSEPVSGPGGMRVLQMVKNVRPVVIPFAEARDKVLQDFLADKVARLQTGNERFLQKRADIRVAADLQ